MDFDLTPEEEAFRDEVRVFLREHLPPVKERGPSFLMDWWKAVRKKRWVGFSCARVQRRHSSRGPLGDAE